MQSPEINQSDESRPHFERQNDLINIDNLADQNEGDHHLSDGDSHVSSSNININNPTCLDTEVSRIYYTYPQHNSVTFVTYFG